MLCNGKNTKKRKKYDMIYMMDKDKYRYGERNEKKISLDVIKAQKRHLRAGAVYKLPFGEHYILILNYLFCL